MGRIKTKLIKSKTQEVMAHHGAQVSEDFAENKKLLAEVAVVNSKKLRNAMAGYLVRLKQSED